MQAKKELHIGKNLETLAFLQGKTTEDIFKHFNATSIRSVYDWYKKPDFNTAMLRKMADFLEVEIVEFFRTDLPHKRNISRLNGIGDKDADVLIRASVAFRRKNENND